nr:pilin [Micromonospora sp. DSM 115978]
MHAHTLVSAAGDLLAAAPAPDVVAAKSIPEVIAGIELWIMGILAAVATLFLVIGGLRYMTAGGDPAQAEQAKGNFKAALAGYALAILAPVILQVLQGILGG